MKENIRSTRRENGPVILSDTMAEVRSVTLGFFYRVGSRNEPAGLNGITHFIEHCVFKGTQKRPAREIADLQDRLGGNLDAFTTHEETGFVLKVVDDRFDTAFELLSDMLYEPKFDESDLANEQKVIIEEIKMNEDSPEDLLSDIFHRDFFPGHPLGLAITGTPDDVRSFGKAATANYHSSAFRPENLIITAAGNIDHERLVDAADKLAGRKEWQNSVEFAELVPPRPASPITIEIRPDLEQAHFILAFPFVGAREKRRYAADLLTNVLGGGSSSRLWQKVREDRGLVYSIGASSAMYNDCGFITIAGATSSDQITEVIETTVAELGEVVKEGITEVELGLMKDQAKAAILLDLEDSASRAGSLAQCEMVHGRQIPVEETLAEITAVTLDDVKQLAEEFFTTSKAAFVAIGDISKQPIGRELFEI